MTRKQETVAISIAVTAVMGTMFVLFGIWSANQYTRKFVNESIKQYDSIMVRPHVNDFNNIIDTLKIKADSSLSVNKKILKIVQEWNKK